MNRVTLVGRITKDLELKRTQSGIAFVRFTIAVNRTFANQQGEREADFINCVAWRAQAENMAKYVGKGSLIGVDGRIQTGRYEDPTKGTIYTTDVLAESVQFLESKGTAGRTQPQPQTDPFAPTQSAPTTNTFSTDFNSLNSLDISDDDLPF